MRRTVSALLISCLPPAALAATPGFIDDFNNGIDTWAGGSSLSNPLGGIGGPLDRFLRISEGPFPRFMGAYNAGPDLTGDLRPISGYRFWLSNIDDNEPVEVHVGVGIQGVNFWLNVNGFNPPSFGWQQYEVDLTDESQWVQIIGAGTFEDALAASNRLLFRHDYSPFEQGPDPIAADFGVDLIEVLVSCDGDLDSDGDIDLDDLLLVLGSFGCAGGSCTGDVDGDGDVDLDDLLVVLGTFGVVC